VPRPWSSCSAPCRARPRAGGKHGRLTGRLAGVFAALTLRLTLRLSDKETNLVPVARALREVLRLPLGQARLMAEGLIENGLAGTMVDMELVAGGTQRRQ
jgi:hypothetical protein